MLQNGPAHRRDPSGGRGTLLVFFPAIFERILISRLISNYPLFNFGIKVDIQRSNGRIHSAVISGVNAELQSVTVEWFEGGETKGKEVRTSYD